LPDDKFQAQGYLLFTPGDFSQIDTTPIYVIEEIFNQDLFSVPPSEDTEPIYLIQWTAYIHFAGLISSVSRFISALPKYQVGIADITYQGFLSDSVYLNYLSQITPVYVSYTSVTGLHYPSNFFIPNTTSSNDVQELLTDAGSAKKRGDSIYLRPQNGDTSSLQLWIYYSANVIYDSDETIYNYF